MSSSSSTVVSQAQNLPANPSQTTKFDLQYFFSQWQTIAQVINGNVVLQNTLAAMVASLQSTTANPSTPTATQTLRVVQTDQTANRVWGTAYQNGLGLMQIEGCVNAVAGGATGTITIKWGPTNPPTNNGPSNEVTATVAGKPCAFFLTVGPRMFYEITVSGDLATSPTAWSETITTLS